MVRFSYPRESGITILTILSIDLEFSVLPPRAPTYVLEPAPALLRGLGILSLTFQPFFVIFVGFSSCYWLCTPDKKLESSTLPRALAWFGSLLVSISRFFSVSLSLFTVIHSRLACSGSANFFVIKMFFDRTCLHFNVFAGLRPTDPKLTASLGDSFSCESQSSSVMKLK
jgi:hypothetical protein